MEKISSRSRKYTLRFEEIRLSDVPLVGGKNAALGEMYANVSRMGIRVPGGFAVSAYAYRYFIDESGLKNQIDSLLTKVDTKNIKSLQACGRAVRKLILSATVPDDLQKKIISEYRALEKEYGSRVGVAVRSSATAEDLPGASFAGQQETFLNVSGGGDVIEYTKRCFASLFTDRAISYREDKGFSHFDVALSVAVQKMVRSDLATSGVMFTIDTETGFDEVIIINASYGLGEMIVQGKVTPDEFIVFKPTLEKGYRSVIARNIGKKDSKMVYAKKGIREVTVQQKDRDRYCLTDDEVLMLAKWGVAIEKYFSRLHGHKQPMDIEWAKDGKTSELFIVQARPETVYSTADKNINEEYRLKKRGTTILEGTAVGKKITSGRARVILDVRDIKKFKKGEVLVTKVTDPDWEPIMKIASAIVTDKGGRTSHAAIVSRELGIACIVGSEIATKKIKNGQMLTIDCSSGEVGRVYQGSIPFEVITHRLDRIPKTKTKIMVNVGAPDEAFKNHFLPVKGVGLGRLEFIIGSHIGIHPKALFEYEKLKKSTNSKKREIVKKIDKKTVGYKNKVSFYTDELSEGISKIGAAFWPHEVIIRFSDFKTNEYRTLIGGELYEPEEENPMIGWRGASRYYDPKFKDAFILECLAIKKVRKEVGLKNVIPMIPFCRTVEEGKKVLSIMKENGLSKKEDKTFKVYMMCEIPSNVVLADAFLDIFDGMSIGSNDLTQLTLGLDRDSDIINHVADENDDSVKKLIAQVIATCLRRKKYIGICGQAPSDFPDFATFLVERGIESMSLTPDTVVNTLIAVSKKEKQLSKKDAKKKKK